MLTLSVCALLAIIVLLHWLSLRAVMLIVSLAHQVPAAVPTGDVDSIANGSVATR